jgi:hypothetical protein
LTIISEDDYGNDDENEGLFSVLIKKRKIVFKCMHFVNVGFLDVIRMSSGREGEYVRICRCDVMSHRLQPKPIPLKIDDRIHVALAIT